MTKQQRKQLADELGAADRDCQRALERHDRERTDESRRAWRVARVRLERAARGAGVAPKPVSE